MQIGIMYRREYPPEGLPAFAKRAEQLGFAEVLVVEDAFYTSGIASAAIALASTQTIRVSLAIMPAVARNPLFAAMEIATLARAYPGRFVAGFGHGVAEWMRQAGAFPQSQMAALEETAQAVRRLLDGELVNMDGKHVHLRDCQLLLPPQQRPPVSLGVLGPKGMAAAGRSADGVILSEFASVEYIRWALDIVKAERTKAGQPGDPRVTVLQLALPAESSALASQSLLPLVHAALLDHGNDPKLLPAGLHTLAQNVRAANSISDVSQTDMNAMLAAAPRLALAGTPADWQTSLHALQDAGVQQLTLTPHPNAGPEIIETFARWLRW